MAGLAGLMSNPFYMREENGKMVQDLRPDGTTKGLGFYGNIGTKDNAVTELSATVGPPNKEFLSPLINPLTTPAERYGLALGLPPTRDMWDKAQKWGLMRQQQGRSPFVEDADIYRGLYRGK